MSFNYRYFVGRTVTKSMHKILSFRNIPTARFVPYGLSPWYDIQRIGGSRNLQTVFDVGANVGQTSNTLVRYFPDASIHAFEPATEPFEKLSARAARWRNIHVHRLGLSDEKAMLKMSTAHGSRSELNTFVEQTEYEEEFSNTEMVPVETLDSFCEAQEIGHIDVLKVDVQGWELRLFSGAKRLLDNDEIDFIFCEVGFSPEERDMIPFERIHQTMLSNRFVLSGLYDLFRWGKKREIYFGNALYTHCRLARGRS